MRRTYKSKKDTDGVLDHRDVYLNMDEKSSAFDAFYIQNIKQTKREISCVGTSNQYGVASNKVRKRKYVKRIIKEVEPTRRETMSRSTYLTPDKSIRVNKALDPFDLLLNSSPACHVEFKKADDSFHKLLPDYNTPKDGSLDKLLPKQEVKKYIIKKQLKVRKVNRNTSTDSDKENTNKEQSNTTDIRTHELLVERETDNSPKYLDESINKIVKNISLLNNFNRDTLNNSFRTNFRCNRNRLTKNMQSPILQTSPLCSTPFKAKYRGESIYTFSPITLKQHDLTPSYVGVREVNNDSNASIVIVNDNGAHRSSQEKPPSLVTQLPCKDIKCKSLIYETETDSQTSLSTFVDKEIDVKKNIDLHTENRALSSIEISYFQNTDGEPFLGFSNVISEDVPICEKNNVINDELNVLSHHGTPLIKGVMSDVQATGDEITKSFNINKTEVSDNNLSLDSQDSKIANRTNTRENNISLLCRNSEKANSENHSKNIVLHSSNSGKCNKSYTCEKDILDSDDSEKSDKSNVSESSLEPDDSSNSNISKSNKSLEVHHSRATNNNNCGDNISFDSDNEKSIKTNMSENDISLDPNHSKNAYKRYNNEINISLNSDNSEKSNTSNTVESNISLDSCDSEKPNSSCMTENSSLNFETSEKESMYDTCDSEQHSLEVNGSFYKEPRVTISRMSDSLFMKYYEQMANYESQNDRQTNESYTSEDGDYNSFEESSASSWRKSDVSSMEFDRTENKKAKNVPFISSNTNEDAISFNDDDLASTSTVAEERCVSFVTTRRRNDFTTIPNESMYIFDNSYETVSSVDCDKTVLNNTKISLTPNFNLDKSVNSSNMSNKIGVIDTNLDTNYEDDAQVSSIPTRKSPRLFRQSNVTISPDSPIKTGSQSEIDLHEIIITDENATPIEESNKDNVLDDTNYSEYSDARTSITVRKRSTFNMTCSPGSFSKTNSEVKPSIVLQPGKKWERSLSIYRRITMMADHFDNSILDDESLQTKGRKYRQSVISTMEMQECRGLLHNESINSRRSTFVSKPTRSTIRFVKDPDISRVSLSATTVYDDFKGFLNEECDDTLIELSKLSIADAEHEVTVLENFHDTSGRLASARDYVLRRCNQADAILFDECYPDTVLKNCHKIGEGVYGEVFLWRGRDGRARVMKIVPIAGTVKVNGECQKDYQEIISEIVIAMELSALRAPISEIDAHFDEGKDIDTLDLHAIENATDVFNEVLAVRYVYGSYPSRLLDLWELYDECKGSENDNPDILPVDQHYIVLELANAGQDLESYQFNNAEQAYALFWQVAFGLAVGEEAFQFEHRDLHWGNVLIAPTDQKYATFVLRGRAHRVARRGVAATVIDYSLSRVSLSARAPALGPAPAPGPAALYNDLAADDALFDALGDYQFEVYRLMRDKLGNDWKNFEPYTNILWLHYTVDKMITALRYKRTSTKLHKQYIEKLKGIKNRILNYRSAVEFVLTDIE